MNSGPLADLVILEIADDVSGAFAGKCLADLGARVIKLEPLEGDPLRRVDPFAGGLPHIERSALFLWLNTSKESVALDLQSDSGRQLLAKLLGRVDAVLVSPAVQRFEALGMEPERMLAEFPRLVVCAISPFGLTGCHAAWSADDLVRTAMSGWMFMSGQPDREPLTTFETIPSGVTGLAAASAVLMALHEVRRSGNGQVVDVSAQEVLTLCTPYIAVSYSYNGVERPRSGMPFPMTIVPAADGYLGINVLTQAQWEGLCVYAGLEDLLEHPDFATPLDRAAHAAELTAHFARWAGNKQKAATFHEGQQWRVPFGFVPRMDEIPALETHVERQFLVEVDHPEAGTFHYPRVPFLIRGLQAVGRAPLLGEHSASVLASLDHEVAPDV